MHKEPLTPYSPEKMSADTGDTLIPIGTVSADVKPKEAVGEKVVSSTHPPYICCPSVSLRAWPRALCRACSPNPTSR